MKARILKRNLEEVVNPHTHPCSEHSNAVQISEKALAGVETDIYVLERMLKAAESGPIVKTEPEAGAVPTAPTGEKRAPSKARPTKSGSKSGGATTSSSTSASAPSAPQAIETPCPPPQAPVIVVPPVVEPILNELGKSAKEGLKYRTRDLKKWLALPEARKRYTHELEADGCRWTFVTRDLSGVGIVRRETLDMGQGGDLNWRNADGTDGAVYAYLEAPPEQVKCLSGPTNGAARDCGGGVSGAYRIRLYAADRKTVRLFIRELSSAIDNCKTLQGPGLQK